jgi:hypothetical protein
MTDKYLIFDTHTEAFQRAEAEGIKRNMPYYHGGVARFLTLPAKTADGKWALQVLNYDLTEQEEEASVPHVTFPPYPSEEDGDE